MNHIVTPLNKAVDAVILKRLVAWLLKSSIANIRPPGYFTLIGDKAQLAARDSSEVARMLN